MIFARPFDGSTNAIFHPSLIQQIYQDSQLPYRLPNSHPGFANDRKGIFERRAVALHHLTHYLGFLLRRQIAKPN
jgi:hypothetical protein